MPAAIRGLNEEYGFIFSLIEDVVKGVAARISGGIFFMNFELLTFPCREMIKFSIHIYDVSKMNPFIYRICIF